MHCLTLLPEWYIWILQNMAVLPCSSHRPMCPMRQHTIPLPRISRTFLLPASFLMSFQKTY
jgi:hypothetical protein